MGAGLPAMQAPWSFRQTAVMLSQASQLPHKPVHTMEQPGRFTRRCRAPGSYPAYGWRSPTRCHTTPAL
ncbi:hypothetical protein FEM54_16080 [Pseudomonas edaphica]|uniref:Uncharacterized protein n=1 Tax=Pseudomonas edaphica TaxID=2006980 RepID=A0ABY2U3Q9_9PSED|nr:hypothetical protein FEM54_16080 [Pseudomonas edaphica]